MDESMKQERREQFAQEMFGKKFEELDPHQRVQVGGKVGGSLAAGDVAHPERAPEPPAVKFGEDQPAGGERGGEGGGATVDKGTRTGAGGTGPRME